MQDDQGTADSAPDSIGSCFMEADGTLVLRLRASGPGGMIGDATMTYPLDHPNYAEVLEHIGPIQPGETKPVAPWPD